MPLELYQSEWPTLPHMVMVISKPELWLRVMSGSVSYGS